MTDARVLDALAAALDTAIGCADITAIRAELAALPATRAPRPEPPGVAPATAPEPGAGQAVLATWHHLLDLGSLLAGEEELAATARPSVVRVGKELAGRLGVADGDPVTVGTATGALTLPVAITDDLTDGVVWLPTNSPGATVRRILGVTAGALVDVSRADVSQGADR